MEFYASIKYQSILKGLLLLKVIIKVNYLNNPSLSNATELTTVTFIWFFTGENNTMP
jgi:hypothetical protein